MRRIDVSVKPTLDFFQCTQIHGTYHVAVRLRRQFLYSS